jgi:diguanylate cyclase (GGDEF)-like protein
MGQETIENEGKIELLRKASIFSRLKDEELRVVARYSAYRDFPRGNTIFEDGSLGREIFIIKSGEVFITKRQDGTERYVARFIAGECFGELDMLQNSPRTARAAAETDVTLLIFPGEGLSFDEVLSQHPQISSQILHKLLSMIAGRIRSTNRLISEKSPWIQDLRRQLLNDKLTGLYNRTFLEEDFAAILAEHPETSLVFVKPDNFKVVNDNYGHDAGDRVLRLLADTVKSVLREDDVAVRYRGDEFALILPGSSVENAKDISGRLRAAIGGLDISPIIDGNRLDITVSIGVACYPHHAEDCTALTKVAFDTMMNARNSGGDSILTV